MATNVLETGRDAHASRRLENMLLIPMDSPDSIPCIVQCLACGSRKNSGLMYADIEGTPYKAFYCSDTATCVPDKFFSMKEGGKP